MPSHPIEQEAGVIMFELVSYYKDGKTVRDNLARVNAMEGSSLDKFSAAVRQYEHSLEADKAAETPGLRALFLLNGAHVVRKYEGE